MPTDISSDLTRRTDAVPFRSNALAGVESAFSAVSWAAILAGGAGAAAMAMILVTLGAGFGLLAVSPWDSQGSTAATLGIGVIVWSIVIHAVSFGLGGYLSGRLRTKWSDANRDEVFFRDTAHGFVTWAVGILASICIMTSIAGELAKGTATLVAAGAGSAGVSGAIAAYGQSNQSASNQSDLSDYFGDMLVRSPSGNTGAVSGNVSQPSLSTSPRNSASARLIEEVSHILKVSLSNGEVLPGDKAYLAQLVSNQTGMTPAEAEKRVNDVMTQAQRTIEEGKAKAKQIAEDARKAAAGMALWAFIAMLTGAFCASYAATIGGRSRDL